MSNWKAAAPDHVQGFWFRKDTNLHPKLKQHLQECVKYLNGLHTNWLPSTDVETVDKYILRSNVWTLE